jgi:hypothetical protein
MSLKRLKHLRTLHMRLNPAELLGTPRGNEFDATLLTHQVQFMADTFFTQLAHACPLLGALVIGHDRLARNQPRGRRLLPQFCFIKGEQRDSLGRIKTVAVRVSKEVLRATQPATGILELDPCVEAWQRWGGRRCWVDILRTGRGRVGWDGIMAECETRGMGCGFVGRGQVGGSWLLCGSDSSLVQRDRRSLTLDVVRKGMLNLVVSDRSFENPQTWRL